MQSQLDQRPDREARCETWRWYTAPSKTSDKTGVAGSGLCTRNPRESKETLTWAGGSSGAGHQGAEAPHLLPRWLGSGMLTPQKVILPKQQRLKGNPYSGRHRVWVPLSELLSHTRWLDLFFPWLAAWFVLKVTCGMKVKCKLRE